MALNILASTLSMPTRTGHNQRERSQYTPNLRSKSQPGMMSRYGFSSPSTPSQVPNPMKTFFENLLQLSPPRYISSTKPHTNRSKLSSSLSTAMPSNRSSRMKTFRPSPLSILSVHSTHEPSPQHTQPLPTELTLKFRRAGNLILFGIYWCNFAKKKNQLRSMNYQSYLQTAPTTEKYMFDKSNFRIQSYEILPIVQDFFKQPTGQRDLSNTEHIRTCLVDIKPFVRLPKGLQDQLLQHAWYECHPPQRTIVRQGERAAFFYIILSGSAIPTYKRALDGNVETLDVLKRGSTFGEKGLMTDSTQNFTVMAKTKIELLVLWKDDFKSIFMSNDRHCTKDDLRFLKHHVSFLYGFPIDRLYEIPNAIQHCHFGPSEVIAKDTRRMKHIFIVKKGSLTIWKRLDPNSHNRETRKMSHERMQNETGIDTNDEATGDNRTLFSEIQMTGDINETNNNSLDADFRLSRLRRSPMNDQRISSSLSTASQSVTSDVKKFPGFIDKRDRINLIDYDEIPMDKLVEATEQSKRSRSKVKTPTKIHLIHPKKMTYMHVKTLNEGQHFGVADMIFPNQPELTLVSNECECILLSKSSFFQHASDQYKQNLGRSEIPFPTDSVYYKTYHINQIWQRCSKQVYLDAYERMTQQFPQKIKRSVNINTKPQQHQPILIGAV